MKHTNELTHILWDLGRIALFIALLYGAIFGAIRLGTRSKKPGKGKQRVVGGFNRQRRRQEQAMNKRKQRS